MLTIALTDAGLAVQELGDGGCNILTTTGDTVVAIRVPQGERVALGDAVRGSGIVRAAAMPPTPIKRGGNGRGKGAA